MDVIRHDNVTTDRNSAIPIQLSKAGELRMYFRVRQQFLSMMSVECHEKERRIILLEYNFQSRRRIWHLQ